LFPEDKVEVLKRKPGPAGYGTIGRKIPLITNWFPIFTNGKDPFIYHFDVTIEDWRIDDSLGQVTLTETPLPTTSTAQSIPGMAQPEQPSATGAKPKRRRRRKGKGGSKPTPGDEDGDGEDGPEVSEPTPAARQPVSTESSNQTSTVKSRRIPKAKLTKIFFEFVKKHRGVFGETAIGFDGEKNAYAAFLPSQLKNKFTSSIEFEGEGPPFRKYKVKYEEKNICFSSENIPKTILNENKITENLLIN